MVPASDNFMMDAMIAFRLVAVPGLFKYYGTNLPYYSGNANGTQNFFTGWGRQGKHVAESASQDD